MFGLTYPCRDRTPLFVKIHEETGASVGTKGVWYPDRSKATEKDPPLYLHISANSKEVLQNAIDKVNELIAIDMGSLVENKTDRTRERVSYSVERHPKCLTLPFAAQVARGEIASWS
jgi:hypothetical protein